MTSIRYAHKNDITALVEIEDLCFTTDRLSRRNFQYLLSPKSHAVTVVYETEGRIAAYCMLLFNRGTSLTRLYSIATHPDFRGRDIARALMQEIERIGLENDCVAIRLEVKEGNTSAERLYVSMGYKHIGYIDDYYEDHARALRYEKYLVPTTKKELARVPYYPQTLEFTCGPASLLMAMATFDPGLKMDRIAEIELWREATTVFMTSGHGGSDPYGLALAAYHRGYDAALFLNSSDTFFIDTVRSEDKKVVMQLVQEEFQRKLEGLPVEIQHRTIIIDELIDSMNQGWIPIIIISSYRIYREKSPHWVVITGYDDKYIYFHDPFVDYEQDKSPTDCINMFMTKKDFDRMTKYGKKGMRAALLIRKRKD
jgi:ribosomal protein S18 acetylase RimI-like enzyme/predicted double-glycine peptidase